MSVEYEADVQISVDLCTSLTEIRACIALQRAIWNDPDADLIPPSLFVVANKAGGQTLLARAGEKAVGFSLAFPGVHGQTPYLHSHIVGVLPEYQNLHVGRQIKLKQREVALANGIGLLEWTFDPLALRNAHFNIVRLGAVMRSLQPNLYGVTSSPLHGGLPTDRLVAEWWLSSGRVRDALAGAPSAQAGDVAEVRVPAETEVWKRTDVARAAELQAKIRDRFQDLFARGYVVTGFRRDERGGAYVLTPDADTAAMPG